MDAVDIIVVQDGRHEPVDLVGKVEVVEGVSVSYQHTRHHIGFREDVQGRSGYHLKVAKLKSTIQ